MTRTCCTPNTLRDLLIRIAQQPHLVQAKWTDKILDEMLSALRKNHPDITAEQAGCMQWHWAIERAMRKARSEAESLAAGFRSTRKSGQTSKYSSNSCGVGRSRTASSSLSRL